MSRSALKYLGFAVAVVALGLAVGWFAGGPEVTKVTTLERVDVAAPRVVTSAKGTSPAENSSGAEAPSFTPIVVVETAPTGSIEQWEETIGDVLGDSGMDIAGKTSKLLDIFTNLPEAGQIEVAQHLSNLIVDGDDYSRMGKLVVDPKLSPAVSEVLMNDLYNRPGETRLPLLLEIARNPQHTKAGDAHDHLARTLEEDFGQDWHRWEVKAREWIKQNPE
ncbi:MAG: hypothetical protein RL380_1646 [Verrucomicrobiota bacterium]